MLVQIWKWYYAPSAAVRNSPWFKLWTFFTNLLPLIAIIVSARVAYLIKKEDGFNSPDVNHNHYAKGLRVVGEVPEGLDIMRIPKFEHDMLEFIQAILPLTLISFMESYSIARSIASKKNELHILNASQVHIFSNSNFVFIYLI
jgi:MFS superfamily sulfate permease-like transporter